MAVINPSVTIVNGTVDNSPVGATTPSTGTFTTITGQTEVLKGTGSNLLLQSNTFTTTWTTGSATWTSGQTDPFSGSNGWLLTASGANNFYQSIFNTVNGITYTFSIYAKANSLSSFSVPVQLTGVVFTPTFNLAAGTVASTGTGTASITSVGNGWYRCVATATSTAAGTAYFQVNYAGAGTLYFYAAQAEVGTSANAYTATTTTAIYGTPTLSFSGVAGLGLQNDGSLYVQPAGTGALQAQKTDSTATGGNARGANAVDWQTSRTAATQVGSAANTFIGGGSQNTASGQYATVAGGVANTASSFVASAISGWGNTVSGQLSSIVGGYLNTTAGYYNFVGGGYSNSGTANGAVTTQSATMNGTTAVTLSGSNASIKVGQLITGTSIASYTYVAAVSGTSLTLSQAASGSSTSTLSFYTPHGVVVGGGNNQATGSYSFIGGGGDAGTAANRNVASGDWSAIMGGRAGTTRGITGNHVFPACSIPIASGAGYSQSALLVLAKQTTDATATVITSDGGSATTSNQIILPSNSAYYFRGEVVAGKTGAGDTKGWYVEGVIKRGAGVGTTALVGTPTVTSNYADAGASGWAVTATADTTNGGLAITVTGQASTTIRWVCSIRTVEMTF